MFFWNSLAFSMIQRMLAIWSLVPLPFLKPAWTSGSSQFTYCWRVAWRILSITLLKGLSKWSAFLLVLLKSLSLPGLLTCSQVTNNIKSNRQRKILKKQRGSQGEEDSVAPWKVRSMCWIICSGFLFLRRWTWVGGLRPTWEVWPQEPISRN